MTSSAQEFDNILLLSIEDLNDWIEPLGGHPNAVTPNLARLAARSFVFQNAYAPAPACSPSRTATLFGQAPWRTGLYSNDQSWAMAFAPHQNLSIIGRAHAAGWETIGGGKVFHRGKSGLDQTDWTRFDHATPETFAPISAAARSGRIGNKNDFGPVSDSTVMADQRHCDNILKTMVPGARRTFWAHGIYRPHLPFIVPQRYFDMIKTPVRMPPAFKGRVFDPDDMSEWAELPTEARLLPRRWIGRILHEFGEYSAYVHAYLASIAFADDLVGQILDHLDQSGLSKRTLIVLWSDHGWQLGEKLAFKKFTLWERALRVPLMLSGPGISTGDGHEPVSLLDIYPTLLSAMGLDAPHALDGQNLLPLTHRQPGRGDAVSVYQLNTPKRSPKSRLSTSIRTQTHRLIMYRDGYGELYDHRNDPYETHNLLNPDILVSEQNTHDCVSDMIARLPKLADPKTDADLPRNLDTLYRQGQR